MAIKRLLVNIPDKDSPDYYQTVMFAVMVVLVVAIVSSLIVLYQLLNKPLPYFTAIAPNGKQIELIPSEEPNLLTTTITRWAAKAAVASYTYDFVNYQKQAEGARPYYTPQGWADYQNSIASLIQTIRQNQLFVNSVVTGPPVIANQGDLPGHGYVWRVQIPFLVTYQTAETSTHQNFTVLMTIVRIPTYINPAGIGIDQFVMR